MMVVQYPITETLFKAVVETVRKQSAVDFQTFLIQVDAIGHAFIGKAFDNPT
jgi:hypothetical protein